MRRLIAFPCMGETLVGTLDEGTAATGLLIVSGGNEIRLGAHRGMALLAAAIASSGFPVLRFDRRGIGDSSGINGGYTSAGPDIAAAARAFVHESGVTRIVGFGNCDAATALAIFHRTAGIDALILANPWVVETEDDLPPAAAIRARYGERLRSRAFWWRALRGGVDIGKAIKGLKRLSRAKPEDHHDLGHRFTDSIDATETTILLATGDATAIAFSDAMRGHHLSASVEKIETSSHSFARQTDQAALSSAVKAALNRYSAA